jgi:hypothetical protein
MINIGNNDTVLIKGNQNVEKAYIGSTLLYTAPTASLLQDGLVFDFNPANYNSGSTTWNADFGNYTASVTGAVGGGLIYNNGNAVGFDGNKWLQFENAMTASISSSNWEVYVLVNLTTTSSTTYEPTFFAKGTDAPGWYYSYKGGTAVNAGFGYINYQGGAGFATDTLNNGSGFNNGLKGVFPTIPQQFVFSYPSSSTFPQTQYTLNWYGNRTGNTATGDTANITPLSFSGSADANLTFGYGVDGWDNFSGSVERLYAYNRILTLAERKSNWYTLTGQYIS